MIEGITTAGVIVGGFSVLIGIILQYLLKPNIDKLATVTNLYRSNLSRFQEVPELKFTDLIRERAGSSEEEAPFTAEDWQEINTLTATRFRLLDLADKLDDVVRVTYRGQFRIVAWWVVLAVSILGVGVLADYLGEAGIPTVGSPLYFPVTLVVVVLFATVYSMILEARNLWRSVVRPTYNLREIQMRFRRLRQADGIQEINTALDEVYEYV